jgi:electron transfer flavoprotein alpha subunit
MAADIVGLIAALRTRSGAASVDGDSAFDLPEPDDAPGLWLGVEQEAAALAMLAAQSDWPLVNDVVAARRENGRYRCRRYVHSGRLIEEIGVGDSHTPVVLIVPQAARSEEYQRRTAELLAQAAIPVRTPTKAGRSLDTLTTARVVVAGGRALRDAATFERLVGGLARALGGVSAASGAAVQAGIAPPELLVGQSGRSVTPELYIALGISGADQHTAGFREARTVVAINSDPQAAIFSCADIGLVADLHTVVPEWVARLRG